MKKRFIKSISLMLIMLVVTTSTVFAANTLGGDVNTLNDVNTKTEVAAKSLPYSSGGVFSNYFTDTFTVDSQTYCSIILSIKGTGNVTFAINKDGSTFFEKEVTADGKGNLWHKTLPAGNYTVLIYGSGGTYAYSTTVYQYG